MVDIISKKDGPREEDVKLKTLIKNNQRTITALADRLTQGNYSRSQQPVVQQPAPDTSSTFYYRFSTPSEKDTKPYIRISINGKVTVVDENSRKQLHHLGDIRRYVLDEKFVLATKDNKFFKPLDAEIAQHLIQFDQVELTDEYTEDNLKADISQTLGFE
ncbi:MAG: hypothetical protein DHS20C07_23520 [Methyloligella sp.]|jgi:hypothetical protein|nr:MAG: hypothetical protein DHS20C07_23520 [Methyloligella sp.]